MADIGAINSFPLKIRGFVQSRTISSLNRIFPRYNTRLPIIEHNLI